MTQSQQIAVTIFIAFMTILGSGVMSTFVTYKLNRRKEDRAMLLERLEKVYLSANRFFISIDCHFVLNHSMLMEDLTPQQVTDQIIKAGMPQDRPHDDAEMLVSLFFPSLVRQFDGVITCRSEANQIFAGFKNRKLNSIESQILFDEVTKKYELAKNEFRKEVKRIAQTIL